MQNQIAANVNDSKCFCPKRRPSSELWSAKYNYVFSLRWTGRVIIHFEQFSRQTQNESESHGYTGYGHSHALKKKTENENRKLSQTSPHRELIGSIKFI